MSAEDDAELDELLRRHVDGPQQRTPWEPRYVAAHPYRMTPDAVGGAGCHAGQDHSRGQPIEPDLPLTAPHLQVHVDDVVVGDGQAGEPIADGERPPLVGSVVVPDDPQACSGTRRAERPGRTRAAELRRRTRPVANTVLAHRHVRDGLACPQRDISEPAGEAADEEEPDCLPDPERTVGLHLRSNVCVRERERLRRRAG